MGHFIIRSHIAITLVGYIPIGQREMIFKEEPLSKNFLNTDNMNYKMIPLDQYMNLVKLDRIPHKRNSLVLLEDGTELMAYGVTLDAGGYIFDHHRGGPVRKEITHVLVNEADLPKQTISKDLLLLNGYKCWNENPEGGEWQKCIKDAAGGKKYFINIKERLGFNGEVNMRNWWPSIQFDVEIDVNTTQNIEVSLVQWFNNSGEWSGVTIEQMEEFCQSVWTRLDGQYYEK